MPRHKPFPSARRSRKISPLGSALDHTLSSYALVAGAAGVGLLALAKPAEAKIVYTPASLRIGHHTFLDLNGDGVNDFQFMNTVSTICNGSHCHLSHQTQAIDTFARLNIYGVAASNQALGAAGYVSQLAAGVSVGSNGPFQGAKLMGGIYGVDGSVLSQYGPWRQGGRLHQGYVGLKFMINGEVHFGWARVKTLAARTLVRAILTGYAYETTPNMPILTGKTSGPDDASLRGLHHAAPSASARGSLGLLAQGATGLTIWRREMVGQN